MASHSSSISKRIIKKVIEKTPYRVVRASTLSAKDRNLAPITLSLVVASYNVEPYIERFLASVLGQTVMPERLEVILVNDGSTDRTGEIIDKWQARYPNIIRVAHQPNGGVCAARNAGLSLATGTWVSFPDPDDFLDHDYFKHMLAEIKRRQKQQLLAVVSNMIFYHEDQDSFSDTHPLRYRFQNGIKRFASNDLGNFIHLTTTFTWLHRETLVQQGLMFDERVKPTFEDAHFFNRLMLLCPNRTVSFLPNAKYYYRKRSDQSSLVDRAKFNPAWYIDQFRYGDLDLLKTGAALFGKAPRHIQRVCLYDVFWRFRYLIDQPQKLDFLTPDQRLSFLTLLNEVFSYIDADTISNFNLAGCTEEHKTALLSIFKGVRRDITAVYIKQVDSRSGQVQFSYHTGGDDHFELKMFVNGSESLPLRRSRRTTENAGKAYFREHLFWLDISDGDCVRFERDGTPCVIKNGGKALGKEVDWITIRNSVVPSTPDKLDDESRRRRDHVLARRDYYRGAWVLMDREDKADDNAEHLYRHLLTNGKAQNAWFILSPESHDWPRLEAEGFKLLPFGSDEHIAAQMNADFLISSHADHFVLWPAQRRNFIDLARYQFVFLQHGVIATDLSRWLNSKPIRQFVTTMPEEYKSITDPEGNYVFSQREVLHSGLPRHDALWAKGQEATADSILIIPTWRKCLTDESQRVGMKRGKVDDFLSSEYATNWLSLLTSPQLRAIAEANSLRVVFAPHPNIAQYLPDMKLPDCIEVVDVLKGASYQDLFARAKVAITCFSSVAAEVAFLQRPIIYFQFDADAIFSGDHVCWRGYFSYEDDGFGPVVRTAEDVVLRLEDALMQREDPIYALRRDKSFPFRDGKCCERVTTALQEILLPRMPVDDGFLEPTFPKWRAG